MVKRIILFSISLLISVITINAIFIFLEIEKSFSFAFPDSFKTEKDIRLFFVDENRIFKLADYKENSNVFPSNTNQETWNVDYLGFRPDHKSNDQLDNNYVILMIGDSFTYCGEVSHLDTYPTILEKLFLDNGFNVNVINAGVPGYGPDQQLAYLRELLPKIKPDLVVWNIYENDITDSNYYCLFEEKNGELKDISAWRNNVYRQGYIVDTLPWSIARQPATKFIAHFVGHPFGGNKKSPISTIGCTKEITSEYLKKLGKKVNLILETAKNETEILNSKIEFVLIPTQQNFIEQKEDSEELEKVEIIKQLSIFEKNDLIEPIEAFKQYKEENNIIIYNELYLSEEEEPGVFSKHLNKKGNTVTAKKVYDHLTRKNYFPKKEDVCLK